MSLASNNKSKLEKDAGWTMMVALCCTDAGEHGDVGDKDLCADNAEGNGVDAGNEAAFGMEAADAALPIWAEIRGRGGGRPRLLKSEHTPNKLTPDCRHSSTVTSSTPSSFCSASLNTSSISSLCCTTTTEDEHCGEERKRLYCMTFGK